jgi:enediyne polyketide synthase
MPLDVGVVANASIEYLVNNILEVQEQHTAMDDSLSNSWIKSFGVKLLPSPLELEEQRGLPAGGTVYVIGQHEPGPRTEAVVATLRTSGIDVQQLSLQQAIDETLAEDLSGMVLILEEEQQTFYDITPAQFKQRMEGLATSLFLLLQKVLPSVTEREEFHLLIIRPKNENDAGSDIDGAAGFLKTLSLEYEKPGFNWKWLTLPGDWEPAAVADCASLELQYFGDRIEYHYSDSGIRLSPTAVQAADTHEKAPRLGGLDTVLVTGGGKGITFEMAFALAQKTGVKLGLLGSSPPPEEDADDGELATNLRRLKGKGIRHLYLQADVTQQEAVQKAVRQIERGLGRISIILHGAGISKFSGFQEMELKNYLRCLRVKASGLYNLLSAVPPKRLKALHVISSVLGRTGMFRQTDYAYANAWLDGATLAVIRNNQSLHGFSVGYSVWDGTGIGAKSGAMDMLQKMGLTPISIDQGVEAYLKLATNLYPYTTFVSTGRLNEKLEPRLMPSLRLPQWRFLENMRRFVPGVELITEATLTHTKDRYLPEHVFAGTPLMPTVMGLEAMTQTAMACIGTEELPLIQQVVLKRPMIISEETGAVVRTLALCDPMDDGITTVVVRMRSDSDGFTADHFEIRCIFGLPQPTGETIPTPPPLPEKAYPKSPEEFAPSPLFQGRFLRRISRIFDIKKAEETLTEITVPVRAQYYSNEFEQQTQTPAPAIQDAMLQAAGLMAPPGYLPESIEQIRYFRPLQEGEKLICWAKATTHDSQALTTDILLYDQAGKPVEWLQGLVVKATSTVVDLQAEQRTKTLLPEQIEESLKRILTGTPLSLAIAYDTDLLQQAALKLLSMQERETLLKDVAEPRRTPKLVNLLATRKSAIQYFRDSDRSGLAPDQVQLSHTADGKPKLTLVDAKSENDELNISLADSHGTSTAVISQMPVGIDIEVVEPRDTETWLALLGDDGYSLAFRLQRETGESFDASATRVWTLIEAGKKAYNLQRAIPRFNQIIDDSWVVLDGSENSDGQMLSTMIHDQGQKFVVSLATSEPAISTKEQHYG